MTWLADAACRDRDPRLWDFDLADEWRAGVRICGGCPVVAECLTDALRSEGSTQIHSRAMIRGGLTPRQRYRLSRKRPAGSPEPVEQPPNRASQWPEGAPCVSCGRPCASDRARRRDPALRDKYLRHVAHGLCLTCYRRAGHDRKAS